MKSNKELQEDIKNDKLTINKTVISNSLNKSLENILMENNRVFLTGVNKYTEKEKMKIYINFLELKKKYFAKILQN